MKKEDISRLRKNYFIHLQLGLAIAIFLVLCAFNWVTPKKENKRISIGERLEEIVEVNPRTVHQKKQLPPPPEKIELTQVEPEIVDFVEAKPKLQTTDIKKAIAKKAPVNVKMPVKKKTPKPRRSKKERKVKKEKIDEDEIFIAIEEMPRYNACEGSELTKNDLKMCSEKAMLEFIYGKIKYPRIAIENEIEGTVVVQFVVEKDGSLSNIKAIREVAGGCSKEALRVIKMMPNWIPGRMNGRSVRVQFVLPIKFVIE